jgi:hypothetical protein
VLCPQSARRDRQCDYSGRETDLEALRRLAETEIGLVKTIIGLAQALREL